LVYEKVKIYTQVVQCIPPTTASDPNLTFEATGRHTELCQLKAKFQRAAPHHHQGRNAVAIDASEPDTCLPDNDDNAVENGSGTHATLWLKPSSIPKNDLGPR